MSIEISIDLDNAAFDDPTELPRILRELADKLEISHPSPGHPVRLYDLNGNRVGLAVIREYIR